MHRYACLGINHKFAPLEVRERLAYADTRVPAALKALREQFGCEEAVVLSTCNRVELYAFSPEADPQERLLEFLARDHGMKAEYLSGLAYYHRGRDAVRHLLRVSGGLDSLVVGETQIVNQLKKAYLLAQSEQATGKALNALFHKAFSVAKRLHTETGIGQGQLSISSVAVTYARRLFETMRDKTALLIGVGEVGELTLTYLREQGIGRILVVSRTLERAREVAARYSADAVPLDLLEDYLHSADIVVSQTSAGRMLLDDAAFKRAMRKRSWRPMFVLDLAVPRDIAPDVAAIPDVYLYNVDDLEQVVAENIESRSAEIARCTAIVEAEVEGFLNGFQTFAVGPLISALRARGAEIKEAELQRVLGRLVDLPESQKDEIAQFAERLLNKLLHGQIALLREAAASPNPSDSLRLITRALGLEQAQEPQPTEHAP